MKRGRGARKAAKGAAAKEEKEITVEFELGQDLQALRNRKGDTGRLSLRLRSLNSLLTRIAHRVGALAGIVCSPTTFSQQYLR